MFQNLQILKEERNGMLVTTNIIFQNIALWHMGGGGEGHGGRLVS